MGGVPGAGLEGNMKAVIDDGCETEERLLSVEATASVVVFLKSEKTKQWVQDRSKVGCMLCTEGSISTALSLRDVWGLGSKESGLALELPEAVNSRAAESQGEQAGAHAGLRGISGCVSSWSQSRSPPKAPRLSFSYMKAS